MKTLLWIAFFVFVSIALIANGSPQLLQFDNTVGMSRLFLIVIWIGFVAYSIFCASQENLFRTIGEINKFHWGRQIGLDLYISVFLSIGLVYLVTGSVFETIFWSAAFIPFANMAILLFVILHLDEIVDVFTSVPHAM